MNHAKIEIDGASKGNPGPAGIGIVISDKSGSPIKEISENIGNATNNIAEYTALVRALDEALMAGFNSASVTTDSELLARQVKGQYKVKNSGIQPLYNSVKELISKFDNFTIEHVKRHLNSRADKLASNAACPEKSKNKINPVREDKPVIKRISVLTNERTQLINITKQIQETVAESCVANGICTVFVPHTTAGITINENADPDVVYDIVQTLNKLVPPSAHYRHSEGNSDSHIKASMMGFSVNIIVENGRLLLGTWQAVYFCEFDGPRNRQVYIRI